MRTGFVGEKVVINGGAFVLPIMHEITPVNMNVMRIEVRRGEGDALITRDRMRVDLIAEFYVRVARSVKPFRSPPRRSAAAPCSRTAAALCPASSSRRCARSPPR